MDDQVADLLFSPPPHHWLDTDMNGDHRSGNANPPQGPSHASAAQGPVLPPPSGTLADANHKIVRAANF